MKKTVVTAAFVVLYAGAANAGSIERACLGSDRPGVSRALCGCIQTVADRTLDWGDQRKAAKFFKDPHQAQVVRQSDNLSDEIFWRKYKAFGETAQLNCS